MRTLIVIAVLFSLPLHASPALLLELRHIQSKAQSTYKRDASAKPSNVTRVYDIIPEGSLASCSHYAALKYTMITKKLPDADVQIAQYYTRPGMYEDDYHALVTVKHDKGWYILDNAGSYVSDVRSLDWMYSPTFGSLSELRAMYRGR